MKLLAPIVTLALSIACCAQNRVILGGVPTSLSLDTSAGIVVAHPTEANTLLVLVPLNAIGQWAQIDNATTMNWAYGSGNWLSCRMDAESWAYISDDGCAHMPAAAGGTPKSLLTTDFDYGPNYYGIAGTPYFPWSNSSYFVGDSQSYIDGNVPGFLIDRWQLRTRGWNQTDLWNGCGPSASITPTFNGWLLAKFSYQFQ